MDAPHLLLPRVSASSGGPGFFFYALFGMLGLCYVLLAIIFLGPQGATIATVDKVIGFVIVALAMFSAVLDNVREFGTLKAIGATNRDLARLLIVQAVVYALIGSLIGLSLVTFVASKIRSPTLAMILPGELLIGTTLVMILMCIIASGLALLRLRKVEPGMVFR